MTPPRSFSGPNYRRNMVRCRGAELPCAHCGRPIDADKAKWWAHVVDGGARYALPGDSVDPAGDMGAHPVGRECKKLLGAYVHVWLGPWPD